MVSVLFSTIQLYLYCKTIYVIWWILLIYIWGQSTFLVVSCYRYKELFSSSLVPVCLCTGMRFEYVNFLIQLLVSFLFLIYYDLSVSSSLSFEEGKGQVFYIPLLCGHILRMLLPIFGYNKSKTSLSMMWWYYLSMFFHATSRWSCLSFFFVWLMQLQLNSSRRLVVRGTCFTYKPFFEYCHLVIDYFELNDAINGFTN